jgi:tetratricopeptide (TPR) repeat protein
MLSLARAALLLASVCLAAGAPAPAQELDLAGKSQQGKALMAAGRYGEAVPVYRELVKALPGNAGLLLNLGMALHMAGEDREAVPQFEAALRLQPDLLPATLLLGAAQMRLGRPAAAVGPLAKAVRLQPDNGEARSMLADALLALERYAEAEPHLRRLAQAFPAEPAVWFNLGKAYEELAGQAFADLLKRDPESAFALALVADARRKQDQRTAAFRLYRLALERRPAFRGLHAAVAGIYRAAGYSDWARVEEEKEQRQPPADCAREELECAFAAGKHRDVAARAAKLATPEAAYWRARAYNELATEAFGRLAALPPSAQSHEWMARSARNEERYAESVEHWRRASALAPSDPRLQLELAVTLRLARDFAAAQRVLEPLARQLPDAPEPNYFLGDVLLAQEQPERALPFLEKSVRLEPNEPQARGALGRAYGLLGRPADAIAHLQHALSADADGSLRYQLARAYQAAGRAEEAQAALQDYEQFRKAAREQARAETEAAAITPP